VINRRAFQRILHRYAEGKSPPDERVLVEQWYALLDDPDAPLTMSQTPADWQKLEARLWQRIQSGTGPGERGGFVRPLGRVWAMSLMRYGLAATVTLVLGVLGWWMSQRSQPETGPMAQRSNLRAGFLEAVNRSERARQLRLSDGSRVVLQPGSAVQYPLRFGRGKREVYLTGAAFFEVVKNPRQPFLVYANELVTNVLGTSFWVRAFASETSVQVVVRTGRVSVFRRTVAVRPAAGSAKTLPATPKNSAGLILTPNQQVVFNRQETTFSKSLVAQPLALQSFDFRFQNAPVSDVLRAISQTYGITILYDEPLLAHCPLTATLTHESLYGKLDLICRAIDADYQVIDGQVVINAGGCEE
jgi:transmembrane sensor